MSRGWRSDEDEDASPPSRWRCTGHTANPCSTQHLISIHMPSGSIVYKVRRRKNPRLEIQEPGHHIIVKNERSFCVPGSSRCCLVKCFVPALPEKATRASKQTFYSISVCLSFRLSEQPRHVLSDVVQYNARLPLPLPPTPPPPPLLLPPLPSILELFSLCLFLLPAPTHRSFERRGFSCVEGVP